MTQYLLKVHLQMFLFITITQKCQILSCDTLVANERYIGHTDKITCILYFGTRSLTLFTGLEGNTKKVIRLARIYT